MTAAIAQDALPAALTLERVAKRYGGELILDGVDLSIRRGESLAIVGPSGSGKSTLLQIMGGLITPDAGRVLLAGAPVSSWDDARARQIGHIFQDSWLIPSLTAAENIEIPMLGVEPSKEARRRRVCAWLERVNLSQRAHARAISLSGGERQRVAFARALVNSPMLVLADEPTGSLDADNTRAAMALLHELCRRQQAAVIIATHDRQVAQSCDRQCALDRGRPVEHGASR